MAALVAGSGFMARIAAVIPMAVAGNRQGVEGGLESREVARLGGELGSWLARA